MAEFSWFWEGTTDGDASVAPYDNDEFTDVFRKLTQLDRDVILPIIHTRDPSEVGDYFPLETAINGNTVQCHPGYAIVDGKVYGLLEINSFYCGRAGYYKLVLRKTFPAVDPGGMPVGQTVKLVMLYDSSGYNDAPTPTRTDGVVWEVTLAAFYSDGQEVTYYPDEFSYVGGDSGRRNFPHGSFSVSFRIGGSSTNWSTAGTARYPVPKARIEVGAFAMSGNPQSQTFVEAFPYTPIVILQPTLSGSIWAGNNICVSAISTTGFSVRADSIVNLDAIQYLAIGPAS